MCGGLEGGVLKGETLGEVSVSGSPAFKCLESTGYTSVHSPSPPPTIKGVLLKPGAGSGLEGGELRGEEVGVSTSRCFTSEPNVESSSWPSSITNPCLQLVDIACAFTIACDFTIKDTRGEERLNSSRDDV